MDVYGLIPAFEEFVSYSLFEGGLSQGCLFLIRPQTTTYFIVNIVKLFTQHRERALHRSQFIQTTCSHLGEKRRAIAHCLFGKATTIKFHIFLCMIFVLVFYGGGGGGQYTCESGNR